MTTFLVTDKSVEKYMRDNLNSLKSYKPSSHISPGLNINLSPVGDGSIYLGTFTGYGDSLLKSANATPFSDFMNVVNVCDAALLSYRSLPFTGKMVGYQPTDLVRSFLYHKKAHRLFFLRATDVLPFVSSLRESLSDEDLKISLF
ncbi:hypothetical protein D3C74_49040 [compost metagenome]